MSSANCQSYSDLNCIDVLHLFSTSCHHLNRAGFEAHASMERGNTIDAGEGPGPMFAKIVERFHPEAFYGNPSRRQVFLVVDLETPAQMAELMYILTWFAGTEPTFTPVMRPEAYAEAIQNAKHIVPPP